MDPRIIELFSQNSMLNVVEIHTDLSNCNELDIPRCVNKRNFYAASNVLDTLQWIIFNNKLNSERVISIYPISHLFIFCPCFFVRRIGREGFKVLVQFDRVSDEARIVYSAVLANIFLKKFMKLLTMEFVRLVRCKNFALTDRL